MRANLLGCLLTRGRYFVPDIGFPEDIVADAIRLFERELLGEAGNQLGYFDGFLVRSATIVLRDLARAVHVIEDIGFARAHFCLQICLLVLRQRQRKKHKSASQG